VKLPGRYKVSPQIAGAIKACRAWSRCRRCRSASRCGSARRCSPWELAGESPGVRRPEKRHKRRLLALRGWPVPAIGRFFVKISTTGMAKSLRGIAFPPPNILSPTRRAAAFSAGSPKTG